MKFSKEKRLGVIKRWEGQSGFDFMEREEALDGSDEKFIEACRTNLRWLENNTGETNKLLSRVISELTS